jgi:hypothetical protein
VGIGYALDDRMATDSPLTFGMPQLGFTRLERLLVYAAPDAAVTVHATPAVAMAVLARRGVGVPPHTTAVTDFVSLRLICARAWRGRAPWTQGRPGAGA